VARDYLAGFLARMWRWLSRITTGLALGTFGALLLILLGLVVGGEIFLLFWLQG